MTARAVCADPQSEAPVATIKGQVIPYSDLQPQIQSDLDRQQHQHDMQVQQLNETYQRARQAFIEGELAKLVDNRVLALEAAARRTTPEALMRAVKPAAVTDEQVKSFYDSQKAQIAEPFDQIAPKIRHYLQAQADERANRTYLDPLRVRYKASVTTEPLREQVGASGPQRGPENAQITIVEFSDFQCPYCRRFTPVLNQILSAYPSQVRLVYRYMPLSGIHPDAQKAAEAAVCAGNQGKFWEMHATLFAAQSSLDVGSLKENAKRLGLRTKQFDDCLDSGQARPTIENDLREAERLGLEATPASFVNGRFVDGSITFDQMTALINDELRRSGDPSYRAVASSRP